MSITHIDFVEELPSTHDLAIQRLQSSDEMGPFAIQAGHQTSGRGRRSKSWQSTPYTQVLLSLGYHPKGLEARNAFHLNIFASLAITDVLASLGIQSKVKWPNDILIHGVKVAGILIQNTIHGSRIKSVVVSMGLNVLSHPELEGVRATSLHAHTNEALDIHDIAIKLSNQVLEYDHLRTVSGIQALHASWQQRLYGLGGWHQFIAKDNKTFTALIEGVSSQGQLLLRREDRRQAYDIDDTRLLLRDSNTCL